MTSTASISLLSHKIQALPAYQRLARTLAASGPLIEANLPNAAVGESCHIHLASGEVRSGVVVGFKNNHTLISPFGPTTEISRNSLVEALGSPLQTRCSSNLLGKAVDALGQIVAELAPKSGNIGNSSAWQVRHLDASPPTPLERQSISEPLETGVRALDALLPIGLGQRLVVLAEPGVGKSSLMLQIAENSAIDINIICLVGERGREISECLAQVARNGCAEKTIIVGSSSDEPAALRAAAAQTAMTISEYFREQGKNVLLQVDSLTRLFRAWRELALAAGEPPARKGYPASVFAAAPRLLERAGKTTHGSITGLFTMLLANDFEQDPMVDEVRGITDGHIFLSRNLAEKGVLPAISISESLSRLERTLLPECAYRNLQLIRRLASRIKNDKDFALLGASGDAELLCAIKFEPEIEEFLRQSIATKISRDKSLADLALLAERIRRDHPPYSCS